MPSFDAQNFKRGARKLEENYEAWLSKAHHVHGKKFDYVAAEKTFTKQQGEPVEIRCKAHKVAFLSNQKSTLVMNMVVVWHAEMKLVHLLNTKLRCLVKDLSQFRATAKYEISASALSSRLEATARRCCPSFAANPRSWSTLQNT